MHEGVATLYLIAVWLRALLRGWSWKCSGFFVVRLWKSQEEKSKNCENKKSTSDIASIPAFVLPFGWHFSLSMCIVRPCREFKKGSQLVLWMFFIHFFFFLQLLNDYWQIFFCFPFVLRSQTREWKLRRTKARQISIIFHTHQHSSAEHCRFQDVRNMKKILGKILILQELINQTTRCASSARGEVKSLLWLFTFSFSSISIPWEFQSLYFNRVPVQWQCTTQQCIVQKELAQLVVFCARVKHSPGPSFDLTLSRFFSALFSSTLSLFMRRPIVVHYIAWDLSEAFDDRQGKVIKESEINWMLNGNRYDDDNDDCVCRTSWAAWHFFLFSYKQFDDSWYGISRSSFTCDRFEFSHIQWHENKIFLLEKSSKTFHRNTFSAASQRTFFFCLKIFMPSSHIE